MPRHDDVKKLAAILFEEFERDAWGDIDPFLFGMIADGLEDSDDDNAEEAQELKKVLKRAVKRLNPCPNCTVYAPCKEHDE
jgi:hypothetical protein